MAKKRPLFKNETEEARWYDEHRDELDDYFDPVTPKQAQEIRDILSGIPKDEAVTQAKEAASRLGPAKAINIRLIPQDIERAKMLAAKKGIGYQTLLKMLIHEALEREESRVS